MDLLLRLLRRPGICHPFSWSGVATIIAWSVLAWSLLGAHLGLLMVGQVSLDVSGFVQIVGTFALASVAGLFAVVAPSGLGVREGVIVAGLSPFVGTGPALALALTSRLMLTIADVVAAGAQRCLPDG